VLAQNAWSWAACVFWRRAKANPHCILLSEARFFVPNRVAGREEENIFTGINRSNPADQFVQHKLPSL
jgi:hypothetical protein